MKRHVPLVALLLAGLTCASAGAEDRDRNAIEVGIRGAGMFGPGDPTNDMLGAGVFLRYRVNPGWAIGVGIDQLNYDVETPIAAVGLSAPEADADGTSDALSVWLERTGRLSRRWEWFAGVGASYVSVDVGPLEGNTHDGAPYSLVNDISDEATVFLDFGVRFEPFDRFRLEAGGRMEQRFGDWTFRETESGLEGAWDDYRTAGVWIGFSYRVRQ